LSLVWLRSQQISNPCLRIAYDVKTRWTLCVYCKDPEIDFAKGSGHVQDVISTIQPHDSPERFESLGVEVIFLAVVVIDRQPLKLMAEILKLELL